MKFQNHLHQMISNICHRATLLLFHSVEQGHYHTQFHLHNEQNTCHCIHFTPHTALHNMEDHSTARNKAAWRGCNSKINARDWLSPHSELSSKKTLNSQLFYRQERSDFIAGGWDTVTNRHSFDLDMVWTTDSALVYYWLHTWHIHTCTNGFMHMHTHKHTHTNTHTHTHTHTHTRARAHTCACTRTHYLP